METKEWKYLRPVLCKSRYGAYTTNYVHWIDDIMNRLYWNRSCGAGGQGGHEESMASVLTVSVSFHQYLTLTQFTPWNFRFYLPLLSRKKKNIYNLSWSSAVLPRPGAPKFSPLGLELIFAASVELSSKGEEKVTATENAIMQKYIFTVVKRNLSCVEW